VPTLCLLGLQHLFSVNKAHTQIEHAETSWSETGRCLPCSALKNPICWEHFEFVIGAYSYSAKTRDVLEDEETHFPASQLSHKFAALGLVLVTSSYS
jgi:hypothetical protein